MVNYVFPVYCCYYILETKDSYEILNVMWVLLHEPIPLILSKSNLRHFFSSLLVCFVKREEMSFWFASISNLRAICQNSKGGTCVPSMSHNKFGHPVVWGRSGWGSHHRWKESEISLPRYSKDGIPSKCEAQFRILVITRIITWRLDSRC